MEGPFLLYIIPASKRTYIGCRSVIYAPIYNNLIYNLIGVYSKGILVSSQSQELLLRSRLRFWLALEVVK